MRILRNYRGHKGVAPFFLTIILTLLFGLFLSQRHVVDPFLYYDLAFVKSSLGETIPTIPLSGPFSSLALAPGRIFLLMALSSSLGISAELLGFLPLGALMVSASYFILVRSLTNSSWVAGFITLYLCLNLSHATAIYSVFAYAFGLPIFFAFVFFARMYSKNRSVKSFTILVFLFIALNVIHYTIASWAILLLFYLFLIRFIQDFRSSRTISRSIQGLFFSSLLLLIVFLGFNQTLYDAYIPLVNQQTLSGAYERFLSYVSLRPNPIHSNYIFIRPSSINLVSTVTLLGIVVVTLTGVLVELRRVFSKKNDSNTLDDDVVLLFALLLVGITDVVIYSFRGSISTKAISILFPIAALIFLKHLGKNRAMLGFSFFLLLSSFAKIVVFENEDYVIRANGTRIADIQTSRNWLEEYGPNERLKILADLNLYGKYLLLSEKNSSPILEALNQENYSALIDSKVQADVPITADLVAIDLNSHQPALGFVWSGFMPIAVFTENYQSNPKLSIIYDDGHIQMGTYSSSWD